MSIGFRAYDLGHVRAYSDFGGCRGFIGLRRVRGSRASEIGQLTGSHTAV